MPHASASKCVLVWALALCLLHGLAATCVPAWLPSAGDPPAPSHSTEYQALGTRQLCENCTVNEQAVVVATGASGNATFAVCRCTAGWKRDAASGACVRCSQDQLCPHLSDVAFDARAACTVPHSAPQSPPMGLEAHWDPVAAAPCIDPADAHFAPAIPFYLGADSHIVRPAGLGAVRCPDGQRPWDPVQDPEHGLVWELDATAQPTTAALDIRVLSERLLLTQDDLQGLTRIRGEDFVRRVGKIFHPVPSPPCVLCGRGFYCTNGQAHPCAINASQVIGATSDDECRGRAVRPAQTDPPPCPPTGLRLRRGAPCVCAGAFTPVPRPDLAAGMACVEDDHGFHPGAGLRVLPTGATEPAARGAAIVATLARENSSVSLHTLASTSHVRVPGLGAGSELLGVMSSPITFGVLGATGNVLRVNMQGGVELLPQPSPARAARPDPVETIQVVRNATLPARWSVVAPGEALFPNARETNDTTLRDLAQQGVTRSLTRDDYQGAGIDNVPLETAVRATEGAVDAAWYVPNTSAAVYITPTLITSISQRGGTGGPPWLFMGHAAAFDPDRELGAVVYAYYAPADNVTRTPNYTITARCWHGDRVADELPAPTPGGAPCGNATFAVTWGDGQRACLDPATCEWQAYHEAALLTGYFATAPTCTRAQSAHGAHGAQSALADTPLVFHDATYVYELARPTQADAAAGRAFGTRTARSGGAQHVGWWALRRAPRPPSACLGFLEQWFDGQCVRCAYNQNCSTAALARSFAEPCAVQRGALRAQTDVCPCPPGFSPDSSSNDCVPCDTSSTSGFCVYGLHYACPQNAEAVSSASTHCVCMPGWARAAPGAECRPCPMDHYCPAGGTGAQRCPNGTGTPQQAGTALMATEDACVPMPGLLAGSLPCPRGTFKSAFASAQNCTPCAANRTTAREGAVHAAECVCRAGFRQNDADAECTPCPPGYACPLGENPQWCTADAQEEIAPHTHACRCMPGFFRVASSCTPCMRGFFCEAGRIERCPRDMTSPPLSAGRTDCVCERSDLVPLVHTPSAVACVCRANFYRMPESGACQACPAHSTAEVGAQSPLDCVCDPGFTPDAGACIACPRGFFCTGRTAKTPCPRGTFAPVPGLTHRDQCLTCNTVGNYGSSGRADPAACWGDFLALSTTEDGRTALDVHHADALIDMDAGDVAEFRARLASASTTRFQAGTAMRSTMISLDPDPQSPDVARTRVHVDMLPDFVTRAVHHVLGSDDAKQHLHGLTRDTHVLSYAIVSSVVFCHFVRDVAVEVAPSTSKTAILCRPRFSGPGAAALFAQARALAHQVMNTGTPMLAAGEVQEHPETALYVWNLRRALSAWQEQSMAVFPQGASTLVITKGHQNAQNPDPETLAYLTADVTPAPCHPIAGAMLDSCTSATVPSATEGYCSYCPHDTFRDTASGQCLSCTQTSAFDGECVFGTRSCCGTHDAVCLARDEADGRCLNGRHDAGEPCDPTDRRTALYKCCTFTCAALQPGYYARDGQCATVCGDGIVARGAGDLPVEECDDTADMRCDMSTCRLRAA